MRSVVLFCLLCLSLICCSKKEKIDDSSTDVPTWLQVKIAAIKKEQHSQLYMVSEYKIGGATFYNITRPASSCMLCELYDVKGIPANISLSVETEVKQVRVIWPVTR